MSAADPATSPAYLELIAELSASVQATDPDDIYQHCANFFQTKLEEQRIELVAIAKGLQAPAPPHQDDHSALYPSDSGDEHYTVDEYLASRQVDEDDENDASYQELQEHEDSADEEEDEEEDDDSVLAHLPHPNTILPGTSPSNGHLTVANGNARGRRISVSAESMAPTGDADYTRIDIPKTEEQRRRIQTAVVSNFLFKHLDEDQARDVVDAMAEKRLAAGETIIRQGGVGDFFYIVETGALDVFVSRNGPEDLGVKVTDYVAGGSFGELALMYNAPRAATIIATAPSVLWALDRVTFRRILMERTSRKRRMYETFLEEVHILMSLEPYEKHKIADALESITFADGDVVIAQGSEGDRFYLIESGRAIVTQRDSSGTDHTLVGLAKGDYFGELALINDAPRAATVTAQGRLKCVTLGKKAFVRLLGPVVEIIKRNAANYQKVSGYVSHQ